MTAEQAASIIKEDLNSFVRSELERAFNEAFADFASKWSKPYPKPMLSLVEKQDAMLAFYEFPKAMRKAICTSNAAESLNSAAKRKTGGGSNTIRRIQRLSSSRRCMRTAIATPGQRNSCWK